MGTITAATARKVAPARLPDRIRDDPEIFFIPRRAVYIFKINHSNTFPFSVASHGHDYYGVCPALQFDPAAAGYQRRVNKGAVDNPFHALTPYSHKTVHGSLHTQTNISTHPGSSHLLRADRKRPAYRECSPDKGARGCTAGSGRCTKEQEGSTAAAHHGRAEDCAE